MHRATMRVLSLVGCYWILVGFSGCASQANQDTRASEEVRYKLAQQESESRNATSPTPASLAKNAEGATAGKLAVAGIETESARVIFVVDGSGSMMTHIKAVRSELSKAIAQLSPTMRFNVIVFKEDACEVMNPLGYLAGDDDARRRANDYLSRVGPHGSSDPTPALNAALAARPDAIFLFSDGDFPNNAALLSELRKSKVAGNVRINTVGVTERSGGDFEQVLRQIAEENGGKFVYLAN
jgi:uncharacterized protein with von Willebrand factor type A (vWA) domain